tara:strand:- start:339 stop:635 length:297 start_codon:yes stop_codon:yes gene_type:complete
MWTHRWGRSVIDAAKANMVREMFRMAIGSRSCGSIATHFDLEYGLKISRAKVYGILQNETYIGKMKYGETEAMNESLALIPKVTFGKARAALRRRKNR